MLARLRKAMQKMDPRKLVGRDRSGNKYYLVTEYKDEKPRRVVEYRDSIAEPDQVPILWHSWLRYNRDEPPTPEEMDKFYAEQDALQARVRQLEEDDEKLRLQEHAERHMQADEDEGGSGMRSAVSALIDDRDVAAYERGASGGDGGGGDNAPPDAPPRDAGTGPSGMGDSFKPGTWSPRK